MATTKKGTFAGALSKARKLLKQKEREHAAATKAINRLNVEIPKLHTTIAALTSLTSNAPAAPPPNVLPMPALPTIREVPDGAGSIPMNKPEATPAETLVEKITQEGEDQWR